MSTEAGSYTSDSGSARSFSRGVSALGAIVYSLLALLLYLVSPTVTVAMLGLLAVYFVFRYPHVAVILIAAGLPFQSLSPKLSSAAVSTLQPATVLLPLAAGAFLLWMILRGDPTLKWNRLANVVLAFGVGLFLLVGLRLLLRPPDELISTNIKTVGRFAMGTILFVLVAQCITDVRRLRAATIAFAVGGVIATAIGLAQYAGLQMIAERGRDFGISELGGLRVYSTLGSPHSFSYLSALVVTLAFAMMLTARTAGKRVFYALAIVFFMAGLVASQTRAGLLAIIVGSLVLLARRRKYGVIMLLVIAVVGLQIYALAVPEAAGRFGETVSTDSGSASVDDPRFEIFREALDYIHSSPFVGTGLIYQSIREQGTAWTAHNSYLDVWMAGGPLLLLLFVLLIWRGCSEMWRCADPDSSAQLQPYSSWLLAALVGIAAFLTVDVLEADFYRPLSFYYLLGLAAAVMRMQAERPMFRRRSRTQVLP